ncbi:MAG: phosphoribosylanthranilate isomerase [Acidimicrobiales bacterium]|nr:phosphoribosylanthranilate isomerase [Acidimicrobiales bacterium]
MFVKICAVTSPADAELAAEAGADAIGMILAPSRRQVGVGQARAIVAAVPPSVLTVGVFRDHSAREVIETVEAVGLRAVQLHGAEPPAISRQVHATVPVVIRAMAVDDPQLPAVDEHAADVVLVDAPVPGGGEVFDWTLLGDLTARHRILLAGGLHPGNVADAIAAVGPWGVDVASGTEASFGKKDPSAVRRFVAEARAAAADLDDPHPPLAIAGQHAESDQP